MMTISTTTTISSTAAAAPPPPPAQEQQQIPRQTTATPVSSSKDEAAAAATKEDEVEERSAKAEEEDEEKQQHHDFCVDCGNGPGTCECHNDEEKEEEQEEEEGGQSEKNKKKKPRVHSINLGQVEVQTINELLADPSRRRLSKKKVMDSPPTPPTATATDEEKEAEAVSPDEEEEEDKPAPASKPRRWLMDRCDGQEKQMDPNSKPCCAIFYAPLVLKFWPDILEQNNVMECLGKTGLVSSTNIIARKIIMTIALLSTIVGWGFLIYSDFAISTQYNFIEAAPFNYGSVSYRANNNNIATSPERNVTRISLGLRAAALSTFSLQSNENYMDRQEITRVIPFENFCGEQEDKSNLTPQQQSMLQTLASRIVFVDPNKCNSCAEASQAMVASILMSTVTYFFTFTTDVLRIWPNYDVNCQKVFGAFFALFSTIMGLRTWFLYKNQCYASFNTGWTCYDTALQPIDCHNIEYDFENDAFYSTNPQVAYHVYLHWQIGGGLIGLGVATFAKVLDLICNFVIPTPSITRNRDEQWEYERLAIRQELGEEGEDNDDNNDDDDDDEEQQQPDESSYSWVWNSTTEWKWTGK